MGLERNNAWWDVSAWEKIVLDIYFQQLIGLQAVARVLTHADLPLDYLFCTYLVLSKMSALFLVNIAQYFFDNANIYIYIRFSLKRKIVN